MSADGCWKPGNADMSRPGYTFTAVLTSARIKLATLGLCFISADDVDAVITADVKFDTVQEHIARVCARICTGSPFAVYMYMCTSSSRYSKSRTLAATTGVRRRGRASCRHAHAKGCPKCRAMPD